MPWREEADGCRAEIVRTTRARIIHLRNDWKDLMGLIEKRLHEHFASLDDEDDDTAAAAAPSATDAALPRDSVPETLDQPFAKVNTVVDNSPAAAAGLQPGDLIRNFGYVSLENHDGLKKVAECVQGNEGVRRRRLSTKHARGGKADGSTAKHPRQGVPKQRRAQAAGTALDADASARLGRQRDARMPYSAAVAVGWLGTGLLGHNRDLSAVSTPAQAVRFGLHSRELSWASCAGRRWITAGSQNSREKFPRTSIIVSTALRRNPCPGW